MMNLREFRTRAGFSQRELAKIIGVQANTICQWENEKRSPSISYVKKIAEILSCTADELLGIEKSPAEKQA